MLLLPSGGFLASVAHLSRSSLRKSKTLVLSRPALEFLDSIESSWKGHERFVVWLVRRMQPKVVVDLGFDCGLSTVAFAYRNNGVVFGIDWFEEGNYISKTLSLDIGFQNISRAIRLEYAKDIHLIIGPFADAAKKWKHRIDILHIDLAHSYEAAKKHYLDWSPHLTSDAVILMHDVVSCPEGAGRAFRELKMPQYIFSHANGLGVATRNVDLLKEIKEFGAALQLISE